MVEIEVERAIVRAAARRIEARADKEEHVLRFYTREGQKIGETVIINGMVSASSVAMILDE